MKLSVLFLTVFCSSHAARILGIVPIPSYSHQTPFQAIFKELSLRGHQVTVITTDPQKNPFLTNLTEIDISSGYAVLANVNFPELIKKSYFSIFTAMATIFNAIIDHMLTQPEVQKIIQNETEHFDLVMLEIFTPAVYAFAERYQCPFIGLSSADAFNKKYRTLENPSHPVMYPDMHSVTEDLTFWNRLSTVFMEALEEIIQNYVLYPSQQILVEKHFKKNYSKLQDIERKMSMLFTNTNSFLHNRRPVLPNIIRIGGGLHIRPPKPLESKLKNMLDGATQGAIYFSLGSNVKSKDLSDETKRIILETFSDLPQLVLWKFEIEDSLKTPKNVITSKWFAQQDVLRHPNVKLFITQGGLQSTEESIHSFVPMIVIPFMGDQLSNARIVAKKEMGLELELANLTKESFKRAILEVLKNLKYRNQVKIISQLIKDEPMTGVEKAVWWAEYVIRHKKTPHLNAKQIPAYQYYLLDVIGFCVVVVGTALLTFWIVLKFLNSLLKGLLFKLKAKID